MDIITIIIGGALAVLLAAFIMRLSFTIIHNLINGRKFHHSLELKFNRLRLSNMLTALGINQTAYIYQTNVNDIKKQMDNCEACSNTDECDDKLSTENIDITELNFCNNEAELVEIKQHQAESEPK